MKKYIFALLAFALDIEAQTGNVITVNLENDAVTRFLQEVTYTSASDASRIKDYNVAPPAQRDIPRPVLISLPSSSDGDSLLLTVADSADYSSVVRMVTIARGMTETAIYNLTPQRTYYYKIEDDKAAILASGEIHTKGRVRMIYVPGARNIRDLVGWSTADGHRIKYGKLFRGSELNGLHSVDSAGMAILTDDLYIQAEMDMRAYYNEDKGISAFGFKTDSWGNGSNPPYYYTSDSGQLPEHLYNQTQRRKWQREFNFIVNNFIRERNVYYHCVWGADRTGYLSVLLEGLLGVDYDNIIKDYELTYFSNGINTKERIDTVMTYIMQVEGSTLQEKFNNFFVDSLSVYQENVDYFLEQMLEEVDTDDDILTAIDDARQSRGLRRPATVVDLWGRRATKAGRKGIVIEIAPDGTARKTVR